MLPCVEVHCGHLVVHWVGLVQVQRLRLTNVGAATDGQIHELLLGNFPNSFIELLDVRGNQRNAKDGAVVGNDLVFN